MYVHTYIIRYQYVFIGSVKTKIIHYAKQCAPSDIVSVSRLLIETRKNSKLRTESNKEAYPYSSEVSEVSK